MSNPFLKVAGLATATQTVEVAGQSFTFSGEGVSVEDKFAVLFPDPVADAQLADHLSAQLGARVPEAIIAAARAIVLAFVPGEDGKKPDISDVVRMAVAQPAAFTHLDIAASQVLGLTTPTRTNGGLADWTDVYRLLRTAFNKGGDQDLVRKAALIAKAALTSSGETPEPLDADTEPLMEALRGNSDAASSDGS